MSCFSDSKDVRLISGGYAELVLPNNTEMKLGETYKFGPLNIIKVEDIIFKDNSNIKLNEEMEKVYNIDRIIKNRNCAFCFSHGVSDHDYAKNNFAYQAIKLYYNEDYITPEEILMLKKIEYLETRKMIYYENYEEEIYNKNLRFLNDIERFSNGKNIYIVLELDSKNLGNFLKTKPNSVKEIINFALKNYVKR